MSGGLGGLNLARAPFLNRRPVWRFATVAWVLGAAILALNVMLWLGYRADSTDLRQRLADVRQEIEVVSTGVVELGSELDALGLESQNARIEFLNERLAERTFPWSRLFERIGSILPLGVKLAGLNPSFGKSGSSRHGRSRETVGLQLQGSARSDEDLYGFVQALFDDPAFSSPTLHNEDVLDGTISFRLDVVYFPRVAAEAGAE